MSRPRSSHTCSACGGAFSRWSGRCPACGEWNTLAEVAVAVQLAGIAQGDASRLRARTGAGRDVPLASPVPLAAVSPEGGLPRPTGVGEVDRVLGGGLVPGSVTLLGGEPGIGKSTLCLQLAAAWAAGGGRVLVVSGEETAAQVRRRAERLRAPFEGLELLATSDLGDVLSACGQSPPELLVVDSIQTIAEPGAVPGSTAQVAAAASRLVGLAKQLGTAVVLIGHVTKDGGLAGPRLLEHLVDTVLSFEGDRHHELRLLSVLKHRFGATGELGVLAMGAQGLVAVPDPSALLLADRCAGIPGNAVVPLMQGHRPICAELQALVAPSPLASPRRAAEGVPASRLAIVSAVLEQRVGLPMSRFDVFTSVVGGLRASEPAADLALALALASALSGRPIDDQAVVCGELGLGGEVRQVRHLERRLGEAARVGFTRAVVPARSPEPPAGMTLRRVSCLAEAIAALAA